VILGAAVLGVIGGRVVPKAFRSAGHAAATGAHEAAVIDDGTPTPPHARHSNRRLAVTVAIFLILWAVVLALLAARFGLEGDFTQMGLFFTKAALLTFGGAYAVLPYVFQAAVETYAWTTASQMIDGLALGETTPGPLIMVVAFVGFVGGWAHAPLGPESPALAGTIGACVATFFTFLPSFLFILAGAPLIERTRDDLKLTAPLTAITAAVVGVIVNLSVFLAWHVFLPQASPQAPFSGPVDWMCVAIAMIAFVALVWRRVGVIPVVAAAAATGLVLWALAR